MQIWSSAFSSMTTQHWKRHGRVTRLAIPEILCEKTWNIIGLSSRKVIALGLQTDEQEIMIAYFLQWKNSAEWDEQVANFKEFRDKLQSAEHFFDTLICGYQRLKWAPKVTKPTNEKKTKCQRLYTCTLTSHIRCSLFYWTKWTYTLGNVLISSYCMLPNHPFISTRTDIWNKHTFVLRV